MNDKEVQGLREEAEHLRSKIRVSFAEIVCCFERNSSPTLYSVCDIRAFTSLYSSVYFYVGSPVPLYTLFERPPCARLVW